MGAEPSILCPQRGDLPRSESEFSFPRSNPLPSASAANRDAGLSDAYVHRHPGSFACQTFNLELPSYLFGPLPHALHAEMAVIRGCSGDVEATSVIRNAQQKTFRTVSQITQPGRV